MFIEILYSDLSRQRVPIEEADQLPKTGVLAVIISCSDDIRPRLDGYRRVVQGVGKDFYYLLNYNDMYALDSRDESDLIRFFKKESPWDVYYKDHPEYTCSMLVFEGEYVPDVVWQEALKIFNDEMH